MKDPAQIDVAVSIVDSSGNSSPGIAKVTLISTQAAFWKGARRASKYLGTVILVALPFGFMEPFMFMVWGSILTLFLLLVVGPLLHMRFASEVKSFSRIEGQCPYCLSNEGLNPYLTTRFESQFTVICPACGQTLRIETYQEYSDKDHS